MHQHGITVGLIKDYAGKWCKDFYKVAIDFERKTDWGQSLGEIKKYLERSEKEILLEYHLGQLKGKAHEGDQKRILGKWSFVRPPFCHKIRDRGYRVSLVELTRM